MFWEVAGKKPKDEKLTATKSWLEFIIYCIKFGVNYKQQTRNTKFLIVSLRHLFIPLQ